MPGIYVNSIFTKHLPLFVVKNKESVKIAMCVNNIKVNLTN